MTSGAVPSRALRLALVAVLIALMAAMAAMTATRRPSATLGSRHASAGVTADPDAVPVAVATTTRPTVATGGLVQAGGGCGLTLGGGVPISPVGHCTVMEIGDSLGNDLGWGLDRELPAASGIVLVQLDRSATGLANSSFYDWPAQVNSDLHTYHPQLVLVCLGGNDQQGIESDGSAVQFPTPAWQEAYLLRVQQLVSEITASGAFVLWVGLPVMQQPSFSQGVQIIDGLYQRAANSAPDDTFLSTWALFSNPQGAFQSEAVVDGAPGPLRQPDGIHFSLTGENVIATYVVDEIASIYHVQIAPTAPAEITGW